MVLRRPNRSNTAPVITRPSPLQTDRTPTSVVAAPLPVPYVLPAAKEENGELKDEYEQITVTVEAEASPATIEYLKSFDGLKAVFTYFDGTDFVSTVIEFSLEEGKIQYLIPLEVLNAASGCPCFINFVC